MFESPKQKTNETNIKKIVGGASDEVREMGLRLHDIRVEEANKPYHLEREKTVEELAMVDLAEANVNTLRGRYGIPPITLPRERMHMIDDTVVTLGDRAIPHAASVNIFESMFFVNIPEHLEAMHHAAKTGVRHLDDIQHECIHLGGYNSLQLTQPDELHVSNLTSYRSGLSVHDRDNQGVHLTPLNEAVTEENARRFTLMIPEDHPVLGDKVRQHRKEFKEFTDFCENNPNHSYPEGLLKGDVLTSRINPVNGRPSVTPFSYYPERQAMWKLFDTVYNNTPEVFEGKSKEDAREFMFNEATKAAMTGNLLPLGRMVNKALGPGAFRSYGHLQTVDEINAFLDERSKG